MIIPLSDAPPLFEPAELWRYRGVLWRRVRQRIRVEYDDMWLGFFWAVARPLIVAVFWAFRGLSEARTEVIISCPLYVYTGLVFWFFFVASMSGVTASLSRDASLVQKAYSPRLIPRWTLQNRPPRRWASETG